MRATSSAFRTRSPRGPVQAAIASAASFTAGAALPLLVAAVTPASVLIVVVAASSLAFLATLGALAARIGGANVLRRRVARDVLGCAGDAADGRCRRAVRHDRQHDASEREQSHGEPSMADNGTDSEDFREHLIRYGGDTYPAIVEKAQGCYVFDADGRKILDFTSGQMCATVGHNHPNIVAAIRKSCDTALHLFSGMIPRSVVQLATAIAKIVPEAAVEIAVREHRQREQRSGDQDGEALHGRLRGRRPRRLVARRHGQRRARCRSRAIARATARACRARSCCPSPTPIAARSATAATTATGRA